MPESDFHKEVYIRKATRWLESGKKVKFQVRFRGREITHPEVGKATLDGISEELREIAEIEQEPKLEGWSMTLLVAPIGSAK